jgi:hypothetical protein
MVDHGLSVSGHFECRNEILEKLFDAIFVTYSIVALGAVDNQVVTPWHLFVVKILFISLLFLLSEILLARRMLGFYLSECDSNCLGAVFESSPFQLSHVFPDLFLDIVRALTFHLFKR